MSNVFTMQGFMIHEPAHDWVALACCTRLPPPAWLDWLTEPHSLTARLKRFSGGDVVVRVLAEEWLTLDNPLLLRQFGPLAAGHSFWSRRVCLYGCGKPWVQAHTLIPEFAWQSGLKGLGRLADKPLGEYLFASNPVLRGSLDITPVGDRQWARRSMFYLHGQPLMVAESFLPALLEAAVQTTASAVLGPTE